MRARDVIYIAYLHKDRYSDFGVSFPDFPGCITAGKTLEEAHRRAAEALALHIAAIIEDGDAIPEPSTLGELAEDPMRNGTVAFLVHVVNRRRSGRCGSTSGRAGKQIEEIDRLANEASLTRSAFMVQSALDHYQGRRRPGRVKHAVKGKAPHLTSK